MKEYQGILQEISDSTQPGNQYHKYRYMEIGNETIKNVSVYSGMNGKIRNAVGHTITLYVQSGLVAGIKTQDGRIFYTDRVGTSLMSAVLLTTIGLPLSFIIIGLPILGFGIMFALHFFALQEMRSMPNAVGI
ncbi:hypothetical protein ACO0LO_01400 [Undibacterium sp. TJN25]|uniref:hypothetical protein n=1 Tax=Undibacterium sp. TJN25 TaxID=3413056 RepID=UPI003BEF8B2C